MKTLPIFKGITALTALLVFFLQMYLLPTMANGATDISGTTFNDTTWSVANSPYHIIGNVSVPAGVTLTIEPGVVIKYTGAFQLLIKGTIVANGTADAPITFTSLTPGISSGATMLKFEGANLTNSQLSYLNMSFASKAIMVGSGGGEFNPGAPCTGTLTCTQLQVEGVEIRTGGCQTTAKLIIDGATISSSTVVGQYPQSEPIEIKNSNITNSTVWSDSYNYGIILDNSTVNSSKFKLGCCGANFDIKNSAILNSSMAEGGGSPVAGPVIILHSTIINSPIDLQLASFTINNSLFSFASTPGIRFGNGTVSGSSFIGDGAGIGLELSGYSGYNVGGSINITNSTFAQNLIGIKLTNANTVSIQNNNFIGNAKYNIENKTQKSIMATGNYWGATEASEISAKIYDYYDDINYGVVDSTGYSMSPVETAPISPPADVQAVFSGMDIIVSWSANSELNTTGYKIYYDSDSGYPYAHVVNVGNVTNYKLTGLSGRIHYIAVTAYNSLADNNNDWIDGNESGLSGEISAVQPPDDYEAEPNNTVINADELPTDEFWQAELLTADTDVFSLSINQAAQIEVEYLSLSASADATIEVLDSAGKVVATTTSINGEQKTISCGLAAGINHLRITSAGDIDENAKYFVSWRVDHFIQDAGSDLAISMGGSHQSTLYSLGGEQAFTFQVQGQQTVALNFLPTSPIAAYTLTLKNAAGTINTWQSVAGKPVTIKTGLANGTYSLLVTQVADVDAVHPFTVSLSAEATVMEREPNNSGLQATALVHGATLSAMLPPADVDLYHFSLDHPTMIKLDLSSSSPTADYRITLFKGSEQYPIDGTISGNGQEVTLNVGLMSGDYLVKVEGNGDMDQDALYTLTLGDASTVGLEIEPNDTLASANGIDPATPRQGRIYSATDQDLYGFTLPTVTPFTITLSPASGTAGDYKIAILNGSGNELASKTSTNGVAATFANFKPKAAGTYYLKVSNGGDVDPFANYTVSMSTTAKAEALVKLTGVQVSAASPTLAVGQTQDLVVTAYYSDAASFLVTTDPDITYVSSDPNVLSVAGNGVVSGLINGHAIVTASWHGKAAAFAITVGTPQTAAKQDHGNLIIVAGGTLTDSDNLKQATLYVSELAYQKFQARNFTNDDIYFMSQTAFHDLNGDGYNDGIVDDLTPTKAEVTSAISGWAKDQVSSGPLYVYLADHGGNQQFEVASGEILTAALLNAALDSFQAATGRPVVVIIEACYSGSFVAPLTSQTYVRLVLTSADANNPSYLSTDGTTSYSSFLFTNLYKGKSIADSLAQTKADLAVIGLPYQKMAPQVAGAETLQELKVGGDFVLAGLFPELGGLTASQALDAKSTGGSLLLNAQVTSLTGGLSVWAVIVPPDYIPPVVSADFETPPDVLPKVVLVDEDPTTKMMDGLFVGNYGWFSKNGDYTVIFYAKDSDNNLVKSAPVTITVSGGVAVVTTTTTTTAAPTTTTTKTAPTTTTTSVTTTTMGVSTTTTTTIEAPTTTTTTEATTTTTIPGNASASLPVSAGWSLVSSTTGIDAALIFGDSTIFTSVWKWADGGTGAKIWAVYLPSDDGGVAYATSKGFMVLSTITSGEGFWVNSKADKSIQVSGTPAYGQLTFSSGWNLVGIKGLQQAAVSELGAVTSVWKWTTVGNVKTWAVNLPGETDTGAAYAASKGFGHFTTIEPGEGFWVNK